MDRRHARRWQRQQRRALEHEPVVGPLPGGRVHTHVRYFCEPPADMGVSTVHVQLEPGLLERCRQRHQEAALEIPVEALDLPLVLA